MNARRMLGNTREFARLVFSRPERTGTAAVPSIADVRARARRRVPRMIFDFVDGGAGSEETLRRNVRDFRHIQFRPRALVDVSGLDLGVRLGSASYPSPVFFGPAGLARLVGNGGELAAVRAAGRYGVPYTISTSSAVSIEEIADAATGPLWFQIYLWRSPELVETLVRRAAAAGCEALVLTVDVPVNANRLRDLRNGMSIPPRITARNVVGAVTHPRWLLQTAVNEPIGFTNFAGIAEGNSALSHSEFINRELSNLSATWDDLERLRRLWSGKLYVKGIMTPGDARRARASGADGIVVSNHGGRQLDGLPSTISVLPRIAAAIGGDLEILLDGGVTTGVDVVKALAAGADAVLVARPWVFGVAMAGEEGAARVLDIFQDELRQTAALLGVASWSELSPDFVDVPATGLAEEG